MHNLDDKHFVSPQVVNILVIHWLPRNYGDVNKPLPRAALTVVHIMEWQITIDIRLLTSCTRQTLIIQ